MKEAEEDTPEESDLHCDMACRCLSDRRFCSSQLSFEVISTVIDTQKTKEGIEPDQNMAQLF